jgi:hypothetical protein
MIHHNLINHIVFLIAAIPTHGCISLTNFAQEFYILGTT